MKPICVKARFFTIIILLITLSISYSCKKDKEEYDGGPTGSGSIFYKGETYSLNSALYESYGEYDGIYYYELYLFSGGIDFEAESGFGNGASIYFSTYNAPLSPGTIPYYSEDVDPIPAVEAEIFLDYNLDEEDGIELWAFVDGELTVSRSGDNTYSIQFVFILEDGKTVTGQYSGKIYEI